MTTTGRPRGARQERPDIAALRQLRRDAPALAVAVDLQIDIVALQRRVQARLTTPWIECTPDAVAAHVASGEPLLRFADIVFDWTEVRLLFRQILDVLRRHDTIEGPEYAELQLLVRAGHPTASEVRDWFESPAARRRGAGYAPPHGETFDQLVGLSAQPFIERASEAYRARADVSAWTRGHCPFCGAEPEMASRSAGGIKRLHCGRCAAAWSFDPDRCPYCDTPDPQQRSSFASADGRYLMEACNVCRRYMKVLDGQRVDRPLMLVVDTIASLPLDAAAARQGYSA